MLTFIKAIKDYLRLSVTSIQLSAINRCFKPAGSALDFWPLFKSEWVDSLRGPSAIIHCLRVSLYEKTFNYVPFQKIGVYIQENQPWEMALIYAWKAAGHGRLIGVPHTTVRYWDLRYFYDYRSYERTGKNLLPIPDLVAVNGEVAKLAYQEGRYPESQLIEVEALRFWHLLNRTNTKVNIKASGKALNVLVCGDFLKETSDKMLSWMAIAAKSLPPDTHYIVKPHPAFPIKVRNYPSLKFEMNEGALADLLKDCDVVFTSNITSASVDAYCSGIPVIQMLDGNTFNMSPLRGLKGGQYVTNPSELVEALRNVCQHEHEIAKPYFYLDEELPRWEKLLSLST